MTRDGAEMCGRCARLDVESHLDQVKQGRGYCLGHEGSTVSRRPFVAWNERACPLFIAARDAGRRERWIEKRQELEKDNADIPQTKG